MPLLRLFVRPMRVGDHMCLTGDTAPFSGKNAPVLVKPRGAMKRPP